MRDISRIEIPRFAWAPQKQFKDKRPIYGFDTETIAGYARLITASDGTYAHVDNFHECARFFFKKKYQGSLNFFYNLRYDYTAVLKHLPRNALEELAEYGIVDYEGWRIKYIPKKFFQLKNISDGHSVSFYDIAQFYHMPLKDAAKYVNMEKLDYDVKELTEEQLYEPEALRYAITDAVICGRLAEYFRDMVSRLVSVRKYYSCASIAKRFVLTRGVKYTLPRDRKLLDMALKSYQGGRFEVLQRGNFDRLYAYDINSAYPEQIAALDGCEGKIVKNKEYEPDAVHSFYKCSVDIYNVIFSPLKWQSPAGLMVYPVGEYDGVYLTKQEYELINDLGFPIRIEEAVHIFKLEPVKPFEWFTELYRQRQKLKREGDELQLAYKYIMNSFYGCMIQHTKALKRVNYETPHYKIQDGEMTFYDGRYRAGTLFNPIWASEITARTRVKLFRDFERQANYMVSVATDGVFLTKKSGVKVGENLGDYDYEEDAGLIIGSGIYHTENKCRFRGFGRKLDLYSALKQNQEKTLIPFRRTRPKNIKESLKSEAIGHENLNVFIEEEKVLNLNFDNKRLWERDFESARDCLNSVIPSAPIRRNS